MKSVLPNSVESFKWAEVVRDSLPKAHIFRVRCEADFYGASFELAEELKLHYPPRSFASWRHGPTIHPLEHPQQILHSCDPLVTHLVANKEEQKYLEDHHYPHVHAVGAPFLYAKVLPIEQRKGSLLIMPGHITGEVRHSWNEKKYLDVVLSNAHQFSSCVACVAPLCAERGLWVNELNARGVPWVLGANSADRFGLRRIKTLLSAFEYVTSNTFSSHIAYAAYCGAKVSLTEPYGAYTFEELASILHVRRFPQLQQIFYKNVSEESVRKRFPGLFVDPCKGQTAIEWGKAVLGESERKNPEIIATLLGWSFAGQLSGYSRWIRNLPGRFQDYIRYRRFPMDI